MTPVAAVVDASAWVECLLLGTGADTLLDGTAHVVPTHCDVEVASGLLRTARSRGVADAREAVTEPFRAYLRLPLLRTWDGDLAVGAWALLDNLSYPDAAYVALALETGLDLVTQDRGMAAGARIRGVPVVSPTEL